MAKTNDELRALTYTNPTGKQRLTLMLAPDVKSELKRQAREAGVSPSAYVAVIVSERKSRG